MRNLTSRGFATLIAVGTMASVAFSITSIGAFGLGLRAAFAPPTHDARVMVMQREAMGPSFSDLAPDTIRRITAFSEVKRSSMELLDEIETRRSDGTIELQGLRGLDPSGFEMHEARVVAGRLPATGEQELAIGVVLAARHPELSIGNTVRVGNQRFTVVGLFETGTNADGEAWMSREALGRMLKRVGASILVVDAATPADAEYLVERLQQMKSPLLKAQIESGYFREQFGEFRSLYQALWLILGLVLVGAGFAATSILSIAFERRTAELVLLRALGFRKAAAARLLLVETELIALGGGLIGAGCAAAALHGHVAYTVGGSGTVNFRVLITPVVLAGASLLMLLVGALSSLIPMMRVSRLEIRDGLVE